MNISTKARPILALTAFFGLLLALFGATATPANAVPGDFPAGPSTLTIKKYQHPETAVAPGTGVATDDPGGTPIAGVQFTVKAVPVVGNGPDGVPGGGDDVVLNPSQNQWWDVVQNMTVGQATTAVAGNPATATQTTVANGEAVFTGLPNGLYYVYESSVPAGVTAGAPFLVTLPTVDAAGTGWVTDVNVFPKNSVVSVSKTVADAAAERLGDNFTYTVNADVPFDTTLDAYRIVDDLDARLDYVSSTVELVVSGATSTVPSTIVLAPADYVVTPGSATDGGPVVSVNFTASGLAKLEQASALDPTAQVEWKLAVNANAEGEIVNTATLFPNQAAIDTDSGTDSNGSETHWGSFTVQKVSAADNALPLAGAEFQAYATKADADANTNPLFAANLVTDASGLVTFTGLQYSDYADGAPLAPGNTFWIAEMKAPAGYELLPESMEITVNAATTAPGADMTVENTEKNGGFDYPDAGGLGGKLFYGGAALILMLAIGFAIRTRRRNSI